MTGPAVLRAADRPASAWKNGGGVTREIAAGPAGAALDDFAWRISLADVAEGGPFSSFPGIDRVITVVEGGGMELTVDGSVHRVDQRFLPFAFPGDAETGCRLPGGPIRDFNVMTRRGRTTAEVEFAHADRPLPRDGAGLTVLVLALEGRVRVGGAELGRYDAVLFEGTEAAEGASVHFVDGAGTAAVVALRDMTAP